MSRDAGAILLRTLTGLCVFISKLKLEMVSVGTNFNFINDVKCIGVAGICKVDFD